MEEQEEIRERIDEQELAKKNAAITKEKQKISKLFAKIDKNKRDVVEKLIENVAFMSITLDELKEDIKISAENLSAIKKGMKGVTSESGGTAYAYFSDLDMTIAGKTGSAQTGVGDEAHGWFAGFAPYNDPEIAVVVLIEKAGSGGYTAETAKKIIKEYFGMNSEEVNENKEAQSSLQSVR